MEEKNYTGLITENHEGKEITAEHYVILNNTTAAKSLYQKAKQRLLFVNSWAGIYTIDMIKGSEVVASEKFVKQ